MNQIKSSPALLVLSDGTFIEGKSIGYKGIAIGEVVFNTGITGYQEILTDPSYFGQLVTFTYPELGNTGINSNDNEAERAHHETRTVSLTDKIPQIRVRGQIADVIQPAIAIRD